MIAAALTWAALAIERRDGADATMLCVHADWAIGDDAAFREALLRAEEVAIQTQSLVTADALRPLQIQASEHVVSEGL